MSDKQIICPCGWSRMVPRTIRRERRLQILAEHQKVHHPKVGESKEEES